MPTICGNCPHHPKGESGAPLRETYAGQPSSFPLSTGERNVSKKVHLRRRRRKRRRTVRCGSRCKQMTGDGWLKSEVFWGHIGGGTQTERIQSLSVNRAGGLCLPCKLAYHVNWPILETGMSGKGSVWKPAYLEKRVYLEEQACPGGKTSLYGESGISRETGLPEETCFKKEKPTTKSLWGRPLSIVSVLFVLCRSFWAFWAFGTFSVLLRYVIGA